jgi:hypothetical protein
MTTVTLCTPSLIGDLRLKPQARRVLRYLRKGKSITPMKALVELNISRLAPCIYEIRKHAGYNVSSEVDRDESGHKFARYWLERTPLA